MEDGRTGGGLEDWRRVGGGSEEGWRRIGEGLDDRCSIGFR